MKANKIKYFTGSLCSYDLFFVIFALNLKLETTKDIIKTSRCLGIVITMALKIGCINLAPYTLKRNHGGRAARPMASRNR